MMRIVDFIGVGLLAASLGSLATLMALTRERAPLPLSVAAASQAPEPSVRPEPLVEEGFALRDAVARPAREPEPSASVLSQRQIDALYNRGVDAYVAGRLDRAREAFAHVLDADPENAEAAKALARIDAESL